MVAKTAVSIEKRKERSFLGLLLRPFRVVRNRLTSYLSVNSRDAKKEKVWRRQRRGWAAPVKTGPKGGGDPAVADTGDGTSRAARAARAAMWGAAAERDPRASIAQQIHDASELDCGEFVEDEDVELNELTRSRA